MPAYTKTPFGPRPIVLVADRPEYFLGGFNDKVAPTRMAISQVQISSNVAILTVTVLEGNIPSVGQLVSVQGTAQDSGAFNTSAPVALTAVSINSTTGQGTIQFALTGSNFGPANDGGQAVVTAPETSEAGAVENTIAVAAVFNTLEGGRERTATVVVTFPTAPSGTGAAWTANLQVALRDYDTDYVNINSTTDFTWVSGTSTYLKQYTLQSGLFYRLSVATSAGSTGTGQVIAKILA